VKTDRSRRTIPLTEIALQSLRERRVVQLENQLAAGQRWRRSNLVFTTMYGTPFEPSNIRRDFKQVLKLAGLPDTIRLHDLRHAHITLLLMMGVKPRVVMELAGHSQIAVTMNTYGHVIPTQEAEAARLLDSFFQARRQQA
jgi:integrase